MLLRILNKLLVGLIFYAAVKLGKEELRERVTESEVPKGGGGTGRERKNPKEFEGDD